jgi:hypothetical protein
MKSLAARRAIDSQQNLRGKNHENPSSCSERPSLLRGLFGIAIEPPCANVRALNKRTPADEALIEGEAAFAKGEMDNFWGTGPNSAVFNSAIRGSSLRARCRSKEMGPISLST